jgi:AcrR family transcriptional regulator
VARNIHHSESATRRHILRAARRSFSRRGYAAASVQEIVDAARVSKPALYYYFADKADLFRALVDAAHDERFRLMQEAASRAKGVRAQLTRILADLFTYLEKNREMMRISFATAFAPEGEMPPGMRCFEKTQRNFEFIHELMKAGQGSGELDGRFEPRELAFGFYGQINAYIMAQLLMPDCALNRQTAGRIVDLFLAGAGTKGAPHPGPQNHSLKISKPSKLAGNGR